MYIDLLIIFVIVSILLFIISAVLSEENPRLSIIFIITGLIFTLYASFGFVQVEYLLGDGTVYTDESYGPAFSIGFIFLGLLYVLLFFYAGFNYMRQVLEEKELQRPR